MSENDLAIQLPRLGSNEVRLPPEVEFTMQRAFGLSIPQKLDDVCNPARLALVVYDMQVGIVNQIENGRQIIDRVLRTATTGLSIASTQTKLWLRCQTKRSAT